MTAKEKVLKIEPEISYFYSSGKLLIYDDSKIIGYHIRDSWAWAQALRYLKGKNKK